MTEERQIRLISGIVTIVLVLSGIILLSLPFITWRWTQTPFSGILFDPNLVVNDSGEESWPAQQGSDDAAFPDRVVAVDGVPVADVADVQAVLAAKEVGSRVPFTLVQPPPDSGFPPRFAETERSKDVLLIPITLWDLGEQFWLFYVTGVIMLVMGVLVFGLRPYTEAAQVFALLMAFTALGVGLLFDTRTTHYFVRLWTLALSLTCGLSVWLASIFPHPSRLMARYPTVKWLVLLPGLLAGLWAQGILFDAQSPWAFVFGWRLLFLLNAVGLLITILIMGYRAMRSPSANVRQQARIILAGAVVGYGPIILYFITATVGINNTWFPQLFFVPLVVLYPATIGFTIVRYRLWNTDEVLRHGMTYGLLVGVLVFALAIVLFSLTVLVGPVLNNPFLITVFIVIVVLVVEPLKRRLQVEVEERFLKQPAVLDNNLRDFNRELTTAVAEDQVASMMLLYVRTGIPDANPDLYLPDGEMSVYRSYYGSNDLLVGADSPLIAGMKRLHGAIDLAEERTWPPVFQQEAEIIRAMETAVIVPMYNEQDLLGWLTLSPKNNHQPYSQSEMTYLASLADQSLIGFERASVVRSLEARVYEQDMLSQFSQALNFTLTLDDMMELVCTNYERLFNLRDFFIYLWDTDTDQNYTAFYLEDGERDESREGITHLVTDPPILEVFDRGQFVTGKFEAGNTWMMAPLKAGRDTLGVIYTYYRKPDIRLRPRQQQLFLTLADQTATALARLETNRQLQARAQQLEIINEVTFSLATTMDLAVLLELILDKAMQLLDTEAGTFMVTDLDNGELEFRVARGPASEGLVGKRLPAGTGLAGTAAQTGQPIIVNHAREDKRWFDELEQDTTFRARALLTVPLIRHNSVWGVIQLINKRNEAPFTEGDQGLLITFASQAVVAMENARLLAQTDEALRKSVNELSLLTQLDRDLNTSLDLTTVLNLALDRTLGIFNGSAGAILLLDEDGRPQRLIHRHYDPAFTLDNLTVESGLVGKTIANRQPYVAANVHEEEDYIAANFATHSQMTLPLLHKQKLIGVMVVESDRLDAFDAEMAETAVRITNHAAIAIANAVLVEQVNAANEAKSDFVSMVSHELKTPMTSMKGYTDLLLSGMTGQLNDQQRGFLDTIAANIRRMSQQIQDLTDISRIETGKLHVTLAPTSLVEVVNETLQIIQGPFDERGIKLHLQLPEDLPLVVADKGRLVQVLTNLLSNAGKYSPPETDVELCFETRLMPNGKSERVTPMVVCSVHDHGFGISAEDRKKLFTKFFRSEDPNIRQAKGTGLGLSITRGIVELHHGEIWVESEVGQGTTFAFSVPQMGLSERR
ncbi:MAG: GAF domain-containing protein [Anaerolineae bacterium]|nr:GAF domain-containing protein [Anaerolineae bacterium]